MLVKSYLYVLVLTWYVLGCKGMIFPLFAFICSKVFVYLYFLMKRIGTMKTVHETERGEFPKSDFEVRAYLKTELAQMYNPNMSVGAAMRKMRMWIRRNRELYTAFYEGGEGVHDQSYSKRQVRLLVRYLEEP